MPKKKAMGRGLSALLNDELKQVQSAKDKGAKSLVGQVINVDVKDIVTHPGQPRTHFDATALEQLAQSIKELGIIQPITVRKKDNKYELISGERRFRASKLAGIQTIPAYIRIADDVELLEMALVENIQREDLDAIEIALSYQKLIEEIELTQEQLSQRVGKERSTITNYLRLLKLDPMVQTGIRDGIISMGHGRAITALDDFKNQLEIYEEIVKNNWSVRQTEKKVQQIKNPTPKSKPKPKVLPNEYKKGLLRWENFFDVEVQIVANKQGKGAITIPFENLEEFERLQKLLE